MKHRNLAMLSLLLTFGGAAEAHAHEDEDCLVVSPRQSPIISYDPFLRTATIGPLELQVSRIRCSHRESDGGGLQIWFADDAQGVPGNRRLGGVPFEIRYEGMNYLARTRDSTGARTYNYGGQNDVTLRFEVTLAAEAMTAFEEGREFSIYYRGTSGTSEIKRVPIRIQMALLPRLDLTVNGGNEASVDFGTLQPNSVKTLNLQARGTQPFVIQLNSAYSGKLRKTASCGVPILRDDPLEAIDYSVTIDSRVIKPNLDTFQGSTQAGRMFEQRLPLSLKIDSTLMPAEKRAGDYCDVLSLRIMPL